MQLFAVYSAIANHNCFEKACQNSTYLINNTYYEIMAKRSIKYYGLIIKCKQCNSSRLHFDINHTDESVLFAISNICCECCVNWYKNYEIIFIRKHSLYTHN